MTRTEKIDHIKKDYPDLYNQLKTGVPNILVNPENATEKDIHIYNQFIVWYSGFLEDSTVLKDLSF